MKEKLIPKYFWWSLQTQNNSLNQLLLINQLINPKIILLIVVTCLQCWERLKGSDLEIKMKRIKRTKRIETLARSRVFICVFFLYLDITNELKTIDFYQYKMQSKLWNNSNCERIQDLVYIKKTKVLEQKVNSLLP